MILPLLHKEDHPRAHCLLKEKAHFLSSKQRSHSCTCFSVIWPLDAQNTLRAPGFDTKTTANFCEVLTTGQTLS